MCRILDYILTFIVINNHTNSYNATLQHWTTTLIRYVTNRNQNEMAFLRPSV